MSSEQRPKPGSYRTADFFVLRSPVLACETYTDLGRDLEAARVDEAELDAAIERDVAKVRQRLQRLLDDPVVREAVFVASPSLLTASSHWLDDPDGPRGHKFERAFIRYVARMSTRATPFGLFAGIALGRMGSHSDLRIGDPTDMVRHTRLDGNYLDELGQVLGRNPDIRQALRYVPNSSAYRVGDRLHMAESWMEGSRRRYQLVDIELDEYLAACLRVASGGATIEELVGQLCSMDEDIEGDEARAYVVELLDSQVLVSLLTPAVTGADPVADLIAQLDMAPAGKSAAQVLRRAQKALAELDRKGLGADPAHYQAIAESLDGLPVATDPSRLFQVDVHHTCPSLTLSQRVADDIVNAVSVASLLATPPGDPLAEFRERFVARYGASEMPLCQVIDDEVGIGFGKAASEDIHVAPLLAGVPLPYRRGRARVQPAHSLNLVDLIADALERGESEVVLPDDPDELPSTGRFPLSALFAAGVRLCGESAAAIDRGDYLLVLDSTRGPPGTTLLGRFCHDHSVLREKVAEYHRHEQSLSDAILAEIVHLPEGRAGNVVFRPVLRDYEIPYLGRSGAPADRQIAITDLWLSVRGRHVTMRSRSLDREVIPRMSTAWRFDYGVPIYRFLCALQDQHKAKVRPDNLEALPHLPRLRAGRVVLMRERWRLGPAAIRELDQGSRRQRFVAMQELRRERRLPRWVGFRIDDHEIPVDLGNPLEVDAFIHRARRQDTVELVEIELLLDGAAIQGRHGRHTNEIIVPFVTEQPAATQKLADRPSSPAPYTATPAQHVFAPGSEWLFIAIDCGPTVADRLLTELLHPFIDETEPLGAFDRWHFVRYDVPEPHLRIRFHGEAATLGGELLPELRDRLAPWLAAGLVRAVRVETYERELDRYGGQSGIELAEAIFTADSRACLSVLSLLEGNEGLDAAWRLTLAGMDRWLDDLGYDLDGKYRHARVAADNFKKEHGAVGPGATMMDRALGARFRGERRSLEDILDRERCKETIFAPGLAPFETRSDTLRPILTELRRGIAAGTIHRSMDQLSWIYLHMFVNRMTRTTARSHEMVLYDFLARIYRSQLARRGRSTTLEDV